MSQKSSGFKAALLLVLGLVIIAAWYAGWSYLFTAWVAEPRVLPLSDFAAAFSSPVKRTRDILTVTGMVPPLVIGGLLALIFYKPLKQFGDARFGNASELAKAGLRAKTGVVIGQAFGQPVVAATPGNVLVCAPPGAGKSTGIAIPTLLQFPGSVMALDTKFELWQNSAGLRAKAGQKTYLFAPMREDSHRFNPLGQLQPGVTLIDEIDRIFNFLIPDPSPGDFWAPAARSLATGVTLHLFASRGYVSIGDVYLFCLDVEPLPNKCMRLLQADEITDVDARRLLADFAAKPPKEGSGVKSTLLAALNLWGNPIVRASTDHSDFDLSAMRRQRMSIYIGVTPPDLVRIERLLALMYQQLMDVLCRALPQPDEIHEVIMLMDEFAAAGQMPLLKKGLALLRGYGVRVVVIIQSPGQLEELYGKAGMRAIMDTCKYRVFYQPNDHETARSISGELGTLTIQTKTRNLSSKGSSRTHGSGKRELMLPDEVMRLGDDRMIVFVEGSRPFRVSKAPFYGNVQLKARAALKPPALGRQFVAPRDASELAEDPAVLEEVQQLLAVLAEEASGRGWASDAAELRAAMKAVVEST